MDGEPWDPALLDWLASDFVGNQYDLKHLIETIMLSRAYQLPAVARDSKEIKDYVFTGPEVRRMTAEEFSDSLRSITGAWRALASRGARTATLVAGLENPAGESVRGAWRWGVLFAIRFIRNATTTRLLCRRSKW